MATRIPRLTLGLDAVRGIEVDVALATGSKRQEPLFLWSDHLQASQQFAGTGRRSHCFPNWQSAETFPVKDSQSVILSYGLGAGSTVPLLKCCLRTIAIFLRKLERSLNRLSTFLGQAHIFAHGFMGNVGVKEFGIDGFEQSHDFLLIQVVVRGWPINHIPADRVSTP